MSSRIRRKSFEFHFTFFGENRIIRLLQVILTGVNEKKAILFFDIFQKNTEGTSGINACGVEGSGLMDKPLNETIDVEARKIQ